MKRFITVVVAGIIFAIIAGSIPKQNYFLEAKAKAATYEESETESYVRDSDVHRIANRHDSVDYGLINIAERLWLMDSVIANGNTADRTVWHDKCKKALINGFDSLHPHSNLSDYMKEDSFLTEMEAFLGRDADFTTMGMIANFDLQGKFLKYRMTALSIQICEYEPSFRKEIESWDNLEKAMYDFCLNAVHLDWFGGSGASPAILAARNSIMQCRIDDLKRVYDLYSGNSTGQSDSVILACTPNAHFKESMAGFKKAVGIICSSIRYVEETNADEEISEYNILYNKIQMAKQPLMKALGKWVTIRNKFPKNKSKFPEVTESKFKENTAVMIDSLTMCVMESKMDV